MKEYKHLQHLRIYLLALFLLFIIAGLEKPAHAAITITNPASCPATLPQGTVGTSYLYTFTVTGGGNPANPWSITAGSLPPGLALSSSSGVLSGTPTLSGIYNFIVRYTGTGGSGSASCACTLTILPILPIGCAFVGTSAGSISFSSIDPSTNPGPITNNSVTQQVIFQCDTAVTYSIATNPANPSLTSGENSILFTLGVAAPGQNFTNTTPISLLTTSSSILAADYQNAPAGSYTSGNIVVTISWTGSSAGSITATATAGGTVINNCAVTQPSGNLIFNIDPSVAGTTLGVIAQDLKIKCTKNAHVAISASSSCGGPAPKLDSSYPVCGGFQIPYAFNILSGATANGFGTGTDISLGIGGSVISAKYADAPAGNYGDLQTVTITY